MIASHGVNGTAATEEHPGSGIQGDFSLSLFQVGAARGGTLLGAAGAAGPWIAHAPMLLCGSIQLPSFSYIISATHGKS